MMKKVIGLILMVVLCLSLCACGDSESNAPLTDYVGVWVREEWTNVKTGAVVNVTVYLYEDGLFKEETRDSINGYEEVQGTWEIDKDTIVLRPTKLVAGTDSLHFDENGNLLEGVSNYRTILSIIDKLTLENGGNKYHKVLD